MPRKSKRGGGSQTEEERLLLQQRRAQTEEEVTRQREEMLTLFLKDKLQKDQRNAEVNLLKINDQWRTILRQTQGAELRGDLMVLSQVFEGHVDILNNIIATLIRELTEAERQSAQVRAAHLQSLEELRGEQEQQLMLLQQLWDRNLQELITGLSQEREEGVEERVQHQQQLQAAAFGLQTQHEAAIDETAALYNKLLASYTAARRHLTSDGPLNSKEDLQRQEDEKVCSCEKKHLEEMIATNKQLLQASNEEMRQAKRLQEKVLRLRQKMSSDQQTEESLQQALTAQMQQVKEKMQDLRLQLQRRQKLSEEQLRDLSVHSGQASRRLQAAIAQGQKVLRVAKLCHQLEIKRGGSWSCVEEDDTPQREQGELPELQQLLKRSTSGVLQREALRRQRDELRQENQQLRLLLRQQLHAAAGNAIAPLRIAYPPPPDSWPRPPAAALPQLLLQQNHGATGPNTQ